MPAKQTYIPFYVPWTDSRDAARVSRAVRSGWITSGPEVARFEDGVRRLVRARYAVAVNSCTAALHLSLLAAGVGPGHEVITSPYTFVATGEAILYCGARPVFADIDHSTLNLAPDAVEAAISTRTRAIIPVHVAGLPCDIRELMAGKRRKRIVLIDDAAHALGSAVGRRPIGSIADMSCFSFYATKNLTTGEGGMVTLADRRTAERIRRLSLHGLSRDAWRRYARSGSWRYDVIEMGFKYNMPDIAASLGLSQLAKWPQIQARRRKIARRYTEILSKTDAFEPPPETAGTTHAWHLYILRIRAGILRIGRDRLIEELARRGIGTSVHFLPLHLHSFYRKTFGYRRGAFPRTERESSRALSLPLYPTLTSSAQGRVLDVLLDLARRYRR